MQEGKQRCWLETWLLATCCSLVPGNSCCSIHHELLANAGAATLLLLLIVAREMWPGILLRAILVRLRAILALGGWLA